MTTTSGAATMTIRGATEARPGRLAAHSRAECKLHMCNPATRFVQVDGDLNLGLRTGLSKPRVAARRLRPARRRGQLTRTRLASSQRHQPSTASPGFMPGTAYILLTLNIRAYHSSCLF